MTDKKLKGILFLAWAIVFIHLETKYFGGNFYPKSLPELIADGFCFGIALIGWYYIFSKLTPKP